MKKLIAVIALSFAFAPAIAGGFLDYENGIEVSQEQFDGLAVGNATHSDVAERIGQPSRKEQLADMQVWYYDFTKVRTFGRNTSESTVFEFDAKGILAKKYKTGRSGKTGNALIDAASR